MSLRIRKDGRILCAAMHPAEPGDTYLHDGISYRLTTEYHVLVSEAMKCNGGRGGHTKHGEWWWDGEEPPDVLIDRWWERPATLVHDYVPGDIPERCAFTWGNIGMCGQHRVHSTHVQPESVTPEEGRER